MKSRDLSKFSTDRVINERQSACESNEKVNLIRALRAQPHVVISNHNKVHGNLSEYDRDDVQTINVDTKIQRHVYCLRAAYNLFVVVENCIFPAGCTWTGQYFNGIVFVDAIKTNAQFITTMVRQLKGPLRTQTGETHSKETTRINLVCVCAVHRQRRLESKTKDNKMHLTYNWSANANSHTKQQKYKL